MLLQKWNYNTNKYDPYEVSNDWKCLIYCENMDEIVNCAHCGKKLKFGDAYTSMEIHTQHGMGYAVCEKCYNNEWTRRRGKEDI